MMQFRVNVESKNRELHSGQIHRPLELKIKIIWRITHEQNY